MSNHPKASRYNGREETEYSAAPDRETKDGCVVIPERTDHRAIRERGIKL